APLRSPASVSGDLARVRLQPRRAFEALAANARGHPGPDGPRTDAAEPGCRADDRGPVRHRTARLPADHGGLADGARHADHGLHHVSDDLVPPARLLARLAGRWDRGDCGLCLVVIVA